MVSGLSEEVGQNWRGEAIGALTTFAVMVAVLVLDGQLGPLSFTSTLSARAGCGARHRRIHPRRSVPPPLARSTSTGRSALPRMSRTPLADAFTRSRPTLHSISLPSRSHRRAPGVSVGSQLRSVSAVANSRGSIQRAGPRGEPRGGRLGLVGNADCTDSNAQRRVGNHFSDSESKRLVRRKTLVPTLRRGNGSCAAPRRFLGEPRNVRPDGSSMSRIGSPIPRPSGS
jgi:hypothetical protein